MNARRATRKVLNAAFKRFQRLPDWASLNPSGNKASQEERREHQGQRERLADITAGDAGLAQTFAE